MAKAPMRVDLSDIRTIATTACLQCGGSPALAKALVDATLSAAISGRRELGFPHLVDYLHSLRAGRINGKAEPHAHHPFPAFIHVDADGGIAQLGFDLMFEGLVTRARSFGVAIFAQKNSYTAGELGYYVRRLASEGLLSLAAANGPALMAASPGTPRVFCTNPIAFGAPLAQGEPPLVIDQAASATAFINIVRAAEEQRPIPPDWAIDQQGRITEDAAQALSGALLPFGGYKGANIALLVEILSAGLSGAAWSTESGDFRSGDRSPEAGMTIIAIAPPASEASFADRSAEQISRLRQQGLHIPGQTRVPPPGETATVEVDADTLAIIRGFCGC